MTYASLHGHHPASATPPETRADILAAARARFGTEGYERTTCARSPPTSASTPRSSSGTSAASRTVRRRRGVHLEPARPLGGGPRQGRRRLLPSFFAVWEDDSTFVALLRAAMTSPTAAETMRKVFASQVAPRWRPSPLTTPPNGPG